MSNRAELVRRLIAYQAAVRAIGDALKEEGRVEFEENGTAATYRMSYANVAGSSSNDRIEVTDAQAFLGYMARRNPTEVQVVQTYAVRNTDWLAQVKDAFAQMSRAEYDVVAAAERQQAENEGRPVVKPQHSQAIDVDGTVIPGVVFKPGGEYVTTSVTPKMGVRKRAIAAARRGVLQGDWSGLEAAIHDPTYLTREDRDEEAAVDHLVGRRIDTLEGL